MQSNLSKIIIALIVVVVILGGAVLWHLSHLSLATQTNTPISYTSGVNVNPGTTVTANQTPGSATQIPAQTTPADIGAAYAQLFQSLLTQEASYTSVDASATGDMATIYTLYASDVAASKKLNPTATNFSIDMATIDVNQDGTAEALVYEDLPGFCGSGGCILDLYQKQQGKWVKIFSTLASGEYVGFSNTLTNGYADLYVTVPGSVGSEPNVMRFTWTGTTYKASNVVAVWTGTQFVTLSQ